MFDFLKKKKKDKDAPEKKIEDNKKTTTEESGQESGKDPGKPVKQKRFPIKLILTLLLVLLAVCVSAFVVYKFWFLPKQSEDMAPVYKKLELAHINLPDEMLEFCFDNFPDLYTAMRQFNREIDLFEKEIERIEQISLTYPDQKKISEKEKKSWIKAKDTLKKTFLKVEKPVKETYVLFRVNKKSGFVQIDEKRKELTQIAQSALVPAQKMTKKLKQIEVVPEGLIKGTLYKLKKKFL
ncbi:MAG: hypothetical protein L3J69_09790 [Desulfobacula sp.]|nr:hypothetical protein [Desulfobacula sp.]